MTHKSSHIIIRSLKQAPDVTPSQVERLEDIELRDEYDWIDRTYMAWLTFTLAAE